MNLSNLSQYDRTTHHYLRGFVFVVQSGLGDIVHTYKTLGEQRHKLAATIRSARRMKARVIRAQCAQVPWQRRYIIAHLRVTLFGSY